MREGGGSYEWPARRLKTYINFYYELKSFLKRAPSGPFVWEGLLRMAGRLSSGGALPNGWPAASQRIFLLQILFKASSFWRFRVRGIFRMADRPHRQPYFTFKLLFTTDLFWSDANLSHMLFMVAAAMCKKLQDGRRETGGRRRETEDAGDGRRRRETGDGRRRRETGDGRRETGDGRDN